MIELSREQARLHRARAQRLGPDRDSGATADVVHACCGIQAQDVRQAPLAVRARTDGITAADVEAALVEDRSIVRTWCMRGTSHYVPTADLPWLLSLFGPLYVDRGERRLADLGFDGDDADRAVAVVGDALAEDGPLTREEIADCLLDAGFEFDPDGQAPIHVVRRACLECIACEAAPRDGEGTYALLDDWVSVDPPLDREDAPDREDALTELARRYVTAYEPTTVDDFASWSGLYKRDVDAGWSAIADELTPVEIDGDRAWMRSSPATFDEIGKEAPTVRLLPMYDGYFLGHGDRDLVVPSEHAKRIHPGGGLIRAAVTVDGLAVATWGLDRSRATARVSVEPFDSLGSIESFDSNRWDDETIRACIAAEVEDLGDFLDTDVEYRIVDEA